MDDHIYSRGLLSSDLKWRQAEIRGIIIFPMMQQLYFSYSLSSLILHFSHTQFLVPKSPYVCKKRDEAMDWNWHL